MRDQFLGRLWEAHHDQFSADLGNAIDSGAKKASALFGGVPMPLKAMAAVLALSVTSLLFSAPQIAADRPIVITAR